MIEFLVMIGTWPTTVINLFNSMDEIMAAKIQDSKHNFRVRSFGAGNAISK